MRHRSFEAVQSSSFDDGTVGVYLHLPYCERICPYCDFAVLRLPQRPAAAEAEYEALLRAELALRAGDFRGRRLGSLYFGGGTPSLFRPETIARLVAQVRAAFPDPVPTPPPGAPDTLDAAGELEITLELNPSTTEREALPGFREAGINRLSIGVQSFNDAQLKRLGRAHRSDVVQETLRAARAARFENLSLDLMFAAPAQTLADLDRDLDAIVEASPEHVSTYELTFEPETPFGQALAKGQLREADEDLAVEMIERIESRLGAADFERYEISSYARPGRRAQHNARYWQRLPVLGLGMGAHSTEARTAEGQWFGRRANPRTLDAYRRDVEAGRPVGTEERISAGMARGEAVFLGLRQREGVSAARFEAEFGGPPRSFFYQEIERMVGQGWLEEGHPGIGDLRLSEAGRLVADSVAAEFVDSVPAED